MRQLKKDDIYYRAVEEIIHLYLPTEKCIRNCFWFLWRDHNDRMRKLVKATQDRKPGSNERLLLEMSKYTSSFLTNNYNDI